MSEIYKDLEKHNTKCFDADNFKYADKESIIKLNTDDRGIIYKIIGAGLNLSNNSVKLYEYISNKLPRKGELSRNDIINDCSRIFLTSKTTIVRSLSELVNKRIIIINSDNKIEFNKKYDFSNIEDENIKYVIIEYKI